jgi:lipid II isoglutaminyl synthase (glutamine-hydrolysing)
MTSWFTIARVLPTMLGTNGSGAGAEIVGTALRRMGHEVSIIDIHGPADVVRTVDFVSVGSGSGSTTGPAATELIGLVPALRSWQDQGAWFFAVGTGWDLLGHHVVVGSGDVIPGVGVFPSSADHRSGRFAGEASGHDYKSRDTAGYINQVGSSTRDEGVQELWSIDSAAGDYPVAEGLISGTLMATRLGGPALALNPHWVDDIVTGMLVARGLAPVASDFHERVAGLAERARGSINGRLGVSR